MQKSAQYISKIHFQNIVVSPPNIPDIVDQVHQLNMGNIADLHIFENNGRKTTTANLVMWNRARHAEVIEDLNGRRYYGTNVVVTANARLGLTDERIPRPEAGHSRQYREPASGDYKLTLAQ